MAKSKEPDIVMTTIPLGVVAVAGFNPPGPLVALTADTITDAQIREAWRLGLIDSFDRNVATRTYRAGMGGTLRSRMRGKVAEILNARRASEGK